MGLQHRDHATLFARATAPRVWLAAASVATATIKPLWKTGTRDPRLSPEDRKAAAVRNVAIRRAYRAGEDLSPDDLGQSFSLLPNRPKPSGPYPLMNFGGDRLVVTAPTRDLLERLDPGPLRFHPIEVFDATGTRPLWRGADLHLMQVLTCRRDVVIEASSGLGRSTGLQADGSDRRMVCAPDLHDALTVTAPADGAPEMWLDDRLAGALFLGDRVVRTLNAARLARGWNLRRCVVDLGV